MMAESRIPEDPRRIPSYHLTGKKSLQCVKEVDVKTKVRKEDKINKKPEGFMQSCCM